MTRDEWAARLNGRQYREEFDDRKEQPLAEKDGVLIVFGYSDDNIETRGIDNEDGEKFCRGIVIDRKDLPKL